MYTQRWYMHRTVTVLVIRYSFKVEDNLPASHLHRRAFGGRGTLHIFRKYYSRAHSGLSPPHIGHRRKHLNVSPVAIYIKQPET